MSSSLAKVGCLLVVLEALAGAPRSNAEFVRGIGQAIPGLLPCPCQHGRVDEGLYAFRHFCSSTGISPFVNRWGSILASNA